MILLQEKDNKMTQKIVYLYGFTDEEVSALNIIELNDDGSAYSVSPLYCDFIVTNTLSIECAAPYLIIHNRVIGDWNEDLEEESGGYHFMFGDHNLNTAPPSIDNFVWFDNKMECDRFWQNYYLYITMNVSELEETWNNNGDLGEHAKECHVCAAMIEEYKEEAIEMANFLPFPVKGV